MEAGEGKKSEISSGPAEGFAEEGAGQGGLAEEGPGRREVRQGAVQRKAVRRPAERSSAEEMKKSTNQNLEIDKHCAKIRNQKNHKNDFFSKMENIKK